MSPQPPGRPELRIGDDERSAAIAALGEHYALGRLTQEEYDERAARAWSARTRSELEPLFADLPHPQPTVPHASPATRPAQRSRSAHPGWWAGAWMVPVLAVVAGLVILTHLPVFLLIVLAWLFLARSGRHWSRSRRRAAGWDGRPWVR